MTTMMTIPGNVRVYLATEPHSMKNSFDGLSDIVKDNLLENPLSGDVFCFVNRRRNMFKLLVYVGTGHTIFYHRLTHGTFKMPHIAGGQRKVELDPTMLALIMEGIDRSLDDWKRDYLDAETPKGELDE